MICIYCLQDKPLSDFKKREHVLPQCFGKFNPGNLILNKSVCDKCNKDLGDTIETDLARDTYEGSIARYKYKIKNPSDFKSLGKKSRIKVRVKEGPLKGSYEYPVYMPEKGKICLEPLPQVGFLRMDSSEYDYFLLDEIPSGIFFNNQVHNISTPGGIVHIGCDHKTAEDALNRKGYSLGPKEDHKVAYIHPGPSKVYGKNDSKIARAIAKIGFNYLSYWEKPEFVLQKDFDPIREYIRFGKHPNFHVISVSKTPILPEERGLGYRKLGHIIVLDWIFMFDRTFLFAFISLFNWTTYSVCLTNNFSGDKREIARGHFFNLYNKTIIELKR